MDTVTQRLRGIFVEELLTRANTPEMKAALAEFGEREPVKGSTGDAVMAAMKRAYELGREDEGLSVRACLV